MNVDEHLVKFHFKFLLSFFQLTAVIGAVFSVLVFRLLIINFMYQNTQNSPFFSQYAKIIATCLAASINAAVIELSGVFFQVKSWECLNVRHKVLCSIAAYSLAKKLKKNITVHFLSDSYKLWKKLSIPNAEGLTILHFQPTFRLAYFKVLINFCICY